jgi:hypothetical protein
MQLDGHFCRRNHRAMLKRVNLALATLAISTLALTSQSSWALETLPSMGYQTPETISQNLNPGGSGTFLFVDAGGHADNGNAGVGDVWQLGVNGPNGLDRGPQQVFATNPGYLVQFSGLFLPASFGSNAGKFATFGYIITGTAQNPGLNKLGAVYTYDPTTAAPTQFATYPPGGGASFFSQAITVPSYNDTPFGSYGGNVLISDEEGRLVALQPDGSITNVANLDGITPFGLAFTPTGFGPSGSLGEKLLVSDTTSGEIVRVSATGDISPFASIPLRDGQTGLRQMSFIPSSWFTGNAPGDGPTDWDLLVSVSGSQFGGGTLGEILVLDGTGAIVASLRLGADFPTFDPRGTLLVDDNTLLIADASDPLLMAHPSDFVSGRIDNSPEPASLAVLALGGFSLLLRRRHPNNQK